MGTGWDALQDRVQRVVDGLVASGRESGVQVCAYVRGELAVDVCAGVADAATGRAVTPDTPFFSYSTGKGLTAAVVHVLAERGELDYDLRLADVWPGYARHGKQDTTLRHALTHSAGVPALPAGITVADFLDWEGMCALVADSAPLWTPGARHGYHAWTYGWLVGETVRRATGRTVSEVLAEEVAAPLGVRGELYFAVPEADLDRLARLADRNLAATLVAMSGKIEHLDEIAPPGVRTTAELGNRRDFLRVDAPATATMTARAVARVYAALMDEVDGVRLISPARLVEVSSVATSGPDWAFGAEVTRGLGYSVEEGGTSFGMGGSGGSLAYAYPELRLAVAATKNLLAAGPEDPMEDLRALIRDAVSTVEG